MRMVMLLFHVLLFGYLDGSFPHKELCSKNDRKSIAKVVSAIFLKHETTNIHIRQARKKAKLEDMCFSWFQDPKTKSVTVNMLWEYALKNPQTHQKKFFMEFLEDSYFTKDDIKRLKLGTFYKKRLKSKS